MLTRDEWSIEGLEREKPEWLIKLDQIRDR